jgi:histidyl-tRNA synthetase
MPLLQSSLQEYMTRYGYQEIELPLVESATLFLTKAGDKVIERLFTFEHRGKTLALRPEFTASAVDLYIRRNSYQEVVRWQFNGAIFEDRTGTQHYQHHSLGAELIGFGGNSADAEIIGMATDGLSSHGLEAYRLVIGHVGLTRHLLQSFQLDDRALRFLLNQRLHLRTVGREGVMEHLDYYLSLRTDVSVNVSAMISEGRAMGGRSRADVARRLADKQRRTASRGQILEALDFLEAWGTICASPIDAFSQIERFINKAAAANYLLENWRSLIDLLSSYSIPIENIFIQPDLARSWDYYTGVVFELRTVDDRLLAGGGRYDELIRLMGGAVNTPAVGFAYYIDEIQKAIGKKPPEYQALTIGGGNAETVVMWAQRLRQKGLSVALLTSGYTVNVIDAQIAEVNGKRMTFDELNGLYI